MRSSARAATGSPGTRPGASAGSSCTDAKARRAWSVGLSPYAGYVAYAGSGILLERTDVILASAGGDRRCARRGGGCVTEGARRPTRIVLVGAGERARADPHPGHPRLRLPARARHRLRALRADDRSARRAVPGADVAPVRRRPLGGRRGRRLGRHEERSRRPLRARGPRRVRLHAYARHPRPRSLEPAGGAALRTVPCGPRVGGQLQPSALRAGAPPARRGQDRGACSGSTSSTAATGTTRSPPSDDSRGPARGASRWIDPTAGAPRSTSPSPRRAGPRRRAASLRGRPDDDRGRERVPRRLPDRAPEGDPHRVPDRRRPLPRPHGRRRARAPDRARRRLLVGARRRAARGPVPHEPDEDPRADGAPRRARGPAVGRALPGRRCDRGQPDDALRRADPGRARARGALLRTAGRVAAPFARSGGEET